MGCDDTEKQWDFWGTCIWDIEAKEIIYSESVSKFVWHLTENWFLAYGYSPWGDVDHSSWLNLHQNLDETRTYQEWHEDTIRWIAWHPSGDYFVALTFGNRLVEFESNTGRALGSHELFSSPARILTWIPETTDILSVSHFDFDYDSEISIWSINSNNQRVPSMSQVFSDVDEIQWIKGTQNFVVHSYGGLGRYFLTEWSADSLQQVSKLWEHFEQGASIPYIRYTSDLNRATFYWSGYVDKIKITDDLFRVFQDNNDITIDFQADNIRQIEWSPDDSMIAVAGNVGDSYFLINIYDTTSGDLISSIQRSWMKYFTKFVWSPDSNLLLIIGERLTGGEANSRTITIYKANKNYSQYSTGFDWYEDVLDDSSNAMSASWSPNSQMIAVSYHDAVKILDVNNGLILAQIPMDSINTLDWHENGQYLAGGASDGTIYVWDVSVLMEK